MKKKLLFALLLFSNYSFAEHRRVIDSLSALLTRAEDDCRRMKVLYYLNVAWINNDPDSSIGYGRQVIQLALQLNSGKELWGSYNNIGYCYYLKGQFDSALSNYDKALGIFQLPVNTKNMDSSSRLNPVWEGHTLSNMGLVYFRIGNYTKSLEYHLASLKISRKEGAAPNYINIANVYNAQSDYKKALQYYRRGLLLADSTNNVNSRQICLSNIGSVYYKMKEYGKGLDFSFRGLKIARETGNNNLIACCLNNIANIYGEMHNYPLALKIYREVLNLAVELKNDDVKAACLISIGSLYLHTKKYASSETYLQEGLKLSNALGTVNYTLQGELYLSALCEKMKRYKLAFDHHVRYTEIKDSLFTREKEDEINSKLLTYEFEKTQAQQKAEQEKKDLLTNAEIRRAKALRNSFASIGGTTVIMSLVSFMFYKRKRDAQLKQRDAEQQAMETAAALRISETELKALLLQMNPHFIDNALQSIQYFLNHNQASEAEVYLVKFSNLMRAVLTSSQRDEILLSEELQTLEWYMQLENLRMTYPFTYDFHIDGNVDMDNTYILPNILQPFVENSIKHGLIPKPGPGKIGIYIRKGDHGLHMIVEDDGIGRKADSAVKQAMLLKRESFGIKITQERLTNLNRRKDSNAAFKIIDLFQNEKPSGTLVELNLPFLS